MGGGDAQPHMHAKTDDAIPSSVVMHIYMTVCLWSVGTDWNVLEPWILLVHTHKVFFKCS